MKVTFYMDDDLVLRARKIAKQRGITVSNLVETGLRIALHQQQRAPVISPVTFRGKGKLAAFKGAPWEATRDGIY